MINKAELIKLQSAGIKQDNKWLLQDINLTLHAGEIMALIGPNGAGKTTLVRVILSLLELNAGHFFRAENTRIGYMPQRCHIDQTMPITVRYFIQLGEISATKQAAKDVLKMVKADHLERKFMYQLSGGELQRVLLARAILRQPNVLVLDEPAQGVDTNGQAELYNTIERIRRELGCAVLMVSHDLHFVMAKTDTVICLNHHICCQGHPDTVKIDPNFLDLFQQNLATYTHHHDHRHD